MFVWLMVSLASSSAVCGTINPTEKSTKPKKEDTHIGNLRHAHSPVQENLTTLQEITTKHRSFKCPKLTRAHSMHATFSH